MAEGNRFRRAQQVTQQQPQQVDPDALARFAAGADSTSTPPAQQDFSVVKISDYEPGVRTKQLLIRVSEELVNDLEFVLKYSTAKSKQDLLESIISNALADYSKKIRNE
ncbi:hypothetical protein [Paludibacterium yongneupense]|uniref:hypothetical protein n=1 Tax=Paludibacterium yongneupense TaxID=400061 RepID=UPI000491EB90|nr:hypothetical protein [Paludibacterium yongneupense]